MCLMHRTTEKDPRQGSPLSASTGRATEKDWAKSPSDHQLQEAQKKDSDRALTPVMEAVCVPVCLAPPGPPQAKQLCYLHAQLSLGQSCHKNLAILHLCTQGRFSHVQFFPCRLQPARLLCQGASPGKNTGAYWPILVAIPFQSTIFPAALATNSPE